MPVVKEAFQHYQVLVNEAKQHTLFGLQGELLITDATIQLMLTALKAFKGGLAPEELVTALIEGEARAITTFSQHPLSNNTPNY